MQAKQKDQKRNKIQQPDHHPIPSDHCVSTNSSSNLMAMEPREGFNLKLMTKIV